MIVFGDWLFAQCPWLIVENARHGPTRLLVTEGHAMSMRSAADHERTEHREAKAARCRRTRINVDGDMAQPRCRPGAGPVSFGFIPAWFDGSTYAAEMIGSAPFASSPLIIHSPNVTDRDADSISLSGRSADAVRIQSDRSGSSSVEQASSSTALRSALRQC